MSDGRAVPYAPQDAPKKDLNPMSDDNELIERESMEVDVLVVGAGPAGLECTLSLIHI